MVVTKHAHKSGGHYLAPDESRLEELGNFIPGIPKEFFDHVVLKPHQERENGLSFSSWEIIKFSTTHKDSSVFVLHSALSGYFPTIDRYLEFHVSGSVKLNTKDEQKDIADKSAPKSKPEGDVKPESEDRRNLPEKE
ncbi:MAG: hypothetical protein ACJAVK_000918 [Akkermansiaceae bacterium]